MHGNKVKEPKETEEELEVMELGREQRKELVLLVDGEVEEKREEPLALALVENREGAFIAVDKEENAR